jgi:hypothetical protein
VRPDRVSVKREFAEVQCVDLGREGKMVGA